MFHTFYGNKHETMYSSSEAYWLRYMWGHFDTCNCPICTSLRRPFPVIHLGTPYPNFVRLAGTQLRVVEGEVRDISSYVSSQKGSGSTPSDQGAVPVPAAPAAATSPEGSLEKKEEPHGSEKKDSQPKEAPQPKESLQELYPKSKPAAKEIEPAKAVKVEPKDSPQSLVDVHVIEEENKKERAQSSGTKRKKSRSRKRHSSRSRRDRKDKRRSRTRSRSRRRRGGSHSPRSSGGRDRKRRDNSPLRPRTPDHPPGPRRPPGPPPHSSQRQGRGWVGPVPYSNHPRWTQGENKGQVQRAKQERYNQRQSRGGRW